MKAKQRDCLLLALATGALALLLHFTGVLDRLELGTWKWRVESLAKPSPQRDRIKLILLDQQSLDWAAGEKLRWPWPWPRQTYTFILDFCAKAKARGIIFDVIFSEGSFPDQDKLLGEGIKRGVPFYGALLLQQASGSDDNQPAHWPKEVPRSLLAKDVAGISALAPIASGGTFPISEVAREVRMLGDVIATPGHDGVIRRSHLLKQLDGVIVPALGIAPLIAQSNAVRFAGNTLSIDGRDVELDDQGRVILNFRKKQNVDDSIYDVHTASSIIQAWAQIEEKKNEGLPLNAAQKSLLKEFEDAYVFFGFSAHGLHDLRHIPLGEAYPGVYVHATLLDNILSGDSLKDSPRWMVVLFVLCLALIVATAMMRLTNLWQMALCFMVACVLAFVIAGVAFVLGQAMPLMVMLFAVAFSTTAVLSYSFLTEGKQRRFVKQAFSMYLSPHVIEQVLANPDQLRLGGERRVLSILFSDLQGFSSISERLDAVELTQLLNDYLNDMTEIVLDEGGTLDKYEGDAIIAFWNAPLSQEDHGLRACRTLVRCQASLAARQQEFYERTGEWLKARIGINTGEVIVGNLGSHKRFDYTVLGDAANLASRLEGANKVFRSYSLISHSTRKTFGDEIKCRYLGKLRVIGREQAVDVYEPLSLGCDGSEAQDKVVAIFELAVRLAQENKFAEAIEQFKTCDPTDAVALRYIERCETLISSDEHWDGIWQMDEK